MKFKLPVGIELARFRPRLLDTLPDYGRQQLIGDVSAGITVGIVALPLAMAFAIASGVKPEQGIFTAIIAGFLISALGGSNVQIGGPAGAFIVIVYGIIERYGLGNLLISTILAGALMFALGALKLGALVRYIPVSIVVGFTAGIAVLIALSQVRDLLGLEIGKLPADFFAQLHAFATHIDSFNPYAFAIGAICFVGLMVWPRLFSEKSVLPPGMRAGGVARIASRIPGPVVALVTMTLATSVLQLPVDTIGTRFGGIPQALPSFSWQDVSWASMKQLFIPTITIAMLGSIESLLCARIADNLSDLPRHDPNQELMAQGVANMVVPLFGGIPATGTIARTVTNVRAGARTPVAGIVHALTLLAIVLAAAPLAMHVPLAALAGILLFVAWNMGEWQEFRRLGQFTAEYRTKLIGTFLLTVIFDLTVAMQVGLVFACVFFIYKMSTLFRAEPVAIAIPGVHVLRLYGALFFGAVTKIEQAAAQLPAGTHTVVLEMHRLVSIDTSGLDALSQLHRSLSRQGVRLVLCDLNEQPRRVIERMHFDAQLGADNIAPDLPSALERLAATDEVQGLA
jgi:SulP family sulfate permease